MKYELSCHTLPVDALAVPLVGILGSLNWVVLRSMLSRMVNKEELGLYKRPHPLLALYSPVR